MEAPWKGLLRLLRLATDFSDSAKAPVCGLEVSADLQGWKSAV